MQNIRLWSRVAAIAGLGLAALNRVSEDLYTTEDCEMTLESLVEGDGFFSKMELGRKRWRETILRNRAESEFSLRTSLCLQISVKL